MAKRKQKGHATVLVLVGRTETTHRGATLKKALAIAERARMRPGCTIEWGRTRKMPSRKIAGGDGVVKCSGKVIDHAYFIAVRKNPRKWRRGRR
jgi:hypothetical protein